jgi:hypothetical protein
MNTASPPEEVCKLTDLAPETGNDDSCYARRRQPALRRIGRRTALQWVTVLLATRMLAGERQAVANDWGRQLPDIPTNFIFGYGSLIETESRESTEGHRTVAIPVRVSAAFGFVRAWADRCTCGFTALGLRRLRAGEIATTINGVIFPVQMGRDMAAYDAREAGYARVSVPPALVEAVGWQRLPERGMIWTYVPIGIGGEPGLELPAPSAAYPMLQSYIDVVLRGALEYGPEFARELIETTSDWSPYWLNDRELARRPWVVTKDWHIIDDVLARVEPAAGALKHRLFSEAYGAKWSAERQGAQ